ncbi:hypothetical protein [Oleiharenicola sp. Vm1]|uniref:hypothetical protein n=1 Tax=Oleiharenicola sp. Vm1 TaxID=3398393 RepID=UPI0039F4D0C8
MSWLEWLEALSYAVTIIGLPLAIAVYVLDRRKERMNDDEEVYLQLADDYEKFLKLVLDHADLRLMTTTVTAAQLTPEQRERRELLFEILIALFERAYILVYEERMTRQAARLWQTWEDYMRAWCRRADFREMLPKLLEGEDPDFARHITSIAGQEGRQAGGA